MPLTSFQLAKEPCMDPEIQTSQGFFPLEVSKFTDCPYDAGAEAIIDPRYKSVFDTGVDTGITEFSMMDENDLVDSLRAPRSYHIFVDLEYEKSQVKLNVWTRPTILWKLECEGETT